MPRKTKEYFQNARTWKQISTNVPPDMLKALKERVTADYTMSHLLRDLIAESEVMRGGYPQPRWSVELSKELCELRREISELREAQAAQEKEELNETTIESATAEVWPIVPAPFLASEKEEAAPAGQLSEAGEKQTKRTRPFAFLEKLPEKLGFVRKTA